MNTDTGSSDKGKRRNAWATPVHSPVLLGLDPLRKQSASIRVHPWFHLILPGLISRENIPAAAMRLSFRASSLNRR